MDIERNVMFFRFEPERSISSYEEFYQGSSDEVNTTDRDMFARKDSDPSIWWKCKNCFTMNTEKECQFSSMQFSDIYFDFKTQEINLQL